MNIQPVPGTQKPAGGPRVFISHTQDDNERLAPLLHALSAWGAQIYFDQQTPMQGMPLSNMTQQAIAECTIFLRICSVESQKSYWANLEQGAFLSLQAEDFRAGRQGARMLVNLILDQGYVRQPFDSGALNIVAFKRPAAQWVNELRGVLGLPPLPARDVPEIGFDTKGRRAPGEQRISRRKVLAGGATTIGILAVAGVTVDLLISRRAGPQTGVNTQVSHKSGDIIWKQVVGDKIVAPAAVTSGLIHVGALDSTLYTFSLDGKSLWHHPSPKGKGIYTTPAVASGIVYTYGNDDYIYALDAKSGATTWTTAPPNGSGKGALGFSAPVVANGVLYIGSYEDAPGTLPGVLKALDAATGHELPGEALNTFVSSTPRVDGSIVYVGTGTENNQQTGLLEQDGYFYALDAKNQLSVLWKLHTGIINFSSAAISGGVAYICSSAVDKTSDATIPAGNPNQNSGYLLAIDLTAHKIRWRFAAGKSLTSSPLVANGLIYFGSDDHNVYAVDATTGKKRWSYATGGTILSSPVLVEGVLYMSSHDGNVYALNPENGTLVRKYAVGGSLTASPVVRDGVIYVGSHDKHMYAIKV